MPPKGRASERKWLGSISRAQRLSHGEMMEEEKEILDLGLWYLQKLGLREVSGENFAQGVKSLLGEEEAKRAFEMLENEDKAYPDYANTECIV